MNHLQPSPQRNARVRSECRQTALSEILKRAIGPYLVHFRYGCRPILAPRSPRPRQSAPFMDFCNSPRHMDLFRRPAAAPIIGSVRTSSSLTDDEVSSLYELDRTHWLHPQGDLGAAPGTVPQLMLSHGEGATLTDVHGRTYIDAMASLWNVNVGYGRQTLADAAAHQMRELAFSSAYGGFGHEPGIQLASRLAELAPGDLQVTFFASGGAEANDTAYKLSRLYWKLRGEPARVNIVSRLRDYHGLTYGATSATGLALFWNDFDPLPGGFLHAPAPDPYRYDGVGRSEERSRGQTES